MRIFLLLPILALTACVNARDPELVRIKQPADTLSSCDILFAHYVENTERARIKITDNNYSDIRDTFVGWMVWPGLPDYKNADGKEGNALLDRNIYLKSLGERKWCKTYDWPEQPGRWD